jgi:hypothetical protein
MNLQDSTNDTAAAGWRRGPRSSLGDLRALGAVRRAEARVRDPETQQQRRDRVVKERCIAAFYLAALATANRLLNEIATQCPSDT